MFIHTFPVPRCSSSCMQIHMSIWCHSPFFWGTLEPSLQCRSAEIISAFVCLNKFLFHLLFHWIRNSRGIHCSSLSILQMSFHGLPGLFLILGLVSLIFAPWFVACQSSVILICLWCTVTWFFVFLLELLGSMELLCFSHLGHYFLGCHALGIPVMHMLELLVPSSHSSPRLCSFSCRLFSVYDSFWIVSGSLSSGS